MEEVYKDLARRLDELPNGFPATASGVELKLLDKLFTPEEAELTCHLWLTPESSKSIAVRLERDEREIRSLLKTMVRKGLIAYEKREKSVGFRILPFVVGFYERQNADIDEEFAQLFEQYYQEVFHNTMNTKPSMHRVIPVETAIPLNIEVMPHQRASEYLESANAWGVLNCICRVQARLIGKGCDHSVNNCLVFSKRTGAFDAVDGIRALSKQEALDILESAQQEGLVATTGNFQRGVNYICNCCTCSCGFLRAVVERSNLDTVARSDFYSVIDESLCTACGECAPRCVFNAIVEGDEYYQIVRERCVGCGLCVEVCSINALRLQQKSSDEKEEPPVDEEEWQQRRVESRKDL